MKINAILAVGTNGLIGVDGGLPWKRISEDMNRFKSLTMGKPVIMGRKTFESLEKPLEGRKNIIVTSLSLCLHHGVAVRKTLNNAIALANMLQADECFLIGGKRIYEEAFDIDIVDRVYLTEVPEKLCRHGENEAYVNLPNFYKGWKFIDGSIDRSNNVKYTISERGRK